MTNAKFPDTNYIVFEYKLPYEGERRPDVLLISASSVVVFEFKDWDRYQVSQADQLLGYKRDLEEYHVETRGKTVYPILVLTLTKGLQNQKKKTYMYVLLTNFRFLAFLQNLFQSPNGSIPTINHFLRFLKLLASMQIMSPYLRFGRPIVQEFRMQ